MEDTSALARENAKGSAKFVQQLLGIEAKLRQYRDGEEFVEAIIAARGMSGFSRIWTSAEHLPTMDEIREPERWLSRVDGSVTPTAAVSTRNRPWKPLTFASTTGSGSVHWKATVAVPWWAGMR